MVVTETRPMGSSADPHAHEHEHSDVDIRSLMISIAVLAAVVLATCLAMWGLFRLYEAGAKKSDPVASPVADTTSTPPEPQLQAYPRKDMDAMRHNTDSVIGTYGWVDKPAGKVHIPIDRAIEIMAARGGSAAAQGTAPQAAPVDTVTAPAAAAPHGGGGTTGEAATATESGAGH
jgi:hypothetical protein